MTRANDRGVKWLEQQARRHFAYACAAMGNSMRYKDAIARFNDCNIKIARIREDEIRAAQAMSARESQDPQGLEAKPASAVPQGCARKSPLMTNNTIMILAERVEAAEGADRELDLAIAKALGLRPQHLSYIPGGSDLAWDAEGGGCGFKVERYTASIDAAMTLIPEGANWRVDCQRDPLFGGPALALVWFEIGRGKEGNAATPALALCAAALKARAHG